MAKRVGPIAEHVAKRLLGARGTRRIVDVVTEAKPWRRHRGKRAVVRAFADTEVDPIAAPTQPDLPTAMALQLRKIHAANRAWDQTHEPLDPQQYREAILAKLATVPLKALCAATGLSMRRCGQIRRGEFVPHPRLWEALARLEPL